MATYTSVQLIDDIDGTSEAAETVQFALDGAQFEIDLTQANADKLRKALTKYVEAGRQVKHTADRGTRRRSGGRTRSREDMAQIRATITSARRVLALARGGLDPRVRYRRLEPRP